MGYINTYKDNIDKIIGKIHVLEEPDAYKDFVYDSIRRWLSVECLLEHIDSDSREVLKKYLKERLF